jgi:flagellar biosynthesis protein FliR
MSGTVISLDGGQVTALFLVLMRTTGFVIAAPLLGHRAIPGMVKAALAAFLAAAVATSAVPAESPLPLPIAVPVELALGLALGFLLSLGMRTTEVIARLLSLQAGLSLSAVYGPTFDEGGTPMDPLFAVLAGLVFLALNLHIALVAALARSFTAFPLGGPINPDLGLFGGELIALMIQIGVELALPLALALLLAQFGIALLSRAIPQLNIFVLGLPMTLLAALVILFAGIPAIMGTIGQIWEIVFRAVTTGTLP